MGAEEAGGVERRVQAHLFAAAQDRRDEVGLDQRLAAGQRHPALGVDQELGIAGDLAQHLARGRRLALVHVPGVGVVTVLAAQRTAGDEQHVADARTVDGAARLGRMDEAVGVTGRQVMLDMAGRN